MDAPALRVIPDEQHDRRRFVGGSDIASILGLQPKSWRTALGTFERKTAPDTAEPESEKETRKRLARGHVVEPLVARMLEVMHGITGANKGHRYVDPDVDYFAAEIDFEIPFSAVAHLFGDAWADQQVQPDEVVNVEIKTVHPFAASEWGDEGTDDVPIHYAAQILWGLGVTRRRFAVCAALFGADDLVLYPMTADAETIAAMRDKATAFWQNHVIPRIAPPAQTLADIGRLFPADDGSVAEATPDIIAAVRTLVAMKNGRDSYGNGVDGVDFLLREYMKTATTLVADGVELATLKQQKTQSIDQAMLKDRFPDAYKATLRTGTTRVLRVKEKAL